MRIYRKGSVWYCDFRWRYGRVRLAGYADKRATEALGRRIEALAALQEAGEKPDRGMAQWLDSLSSDMLARLAKTRLIDQEMAAVRRDLDDHIAAWKASLEAKDASERHIKQAVARVKRIAKDANVPSLRGFERTAVERWLDARRKEGMGATTRNHYLRSVKAFLNWCVYAGLIGENSVAPVKQANERADFRRERRDLSASELRRLLEAAANGAKHHCMEGPERALLYRLAAETGLRWSELRALRRRSFVLDSEAPHVFLPASDTKNGQDARLPLRPGTAELLREHLALKLPDAQAFLMPAGRTGSKMLRRDLSVAGIPYRDEAGRVADFHALRHSFISSLARSGVHPSVAQSLARHSTVTLTMDRYTHTALESQQEAIATLPDLDALPAESVAATGTDAQDAGARLGAHQCRQPRMSVDKPGLLTRTRHDPLAPCKSLPINEKPLPTQGLQGHEDWHPDRESNPDCQLEKLVC